MTSLQYRMIYLMMKNRHLLQGKLLQEVWTENTSIPAFREMCEKQNERMAARLPQGVTVTPVTVDGPPGNERIYAEWITPAGAADDRMILYTIGGGYVSGSCKDHRAITAKIAAKSGVKMLLFEHRLAPEHPFPAAVDDTIAAYEWALRQGYRPENIMIVGESAGGGLCLAALLALRDLGHPLPAAAVAMSPLTDLALTGESHRTRAKQCLSPRGMSDVCTRAYAGNHDRCHPWISPLYGELHGLPPLYIIVGDWETLRDDSTRFAEKARAAGVDVTLRVGERMVHCYPLMAPAFPEATEAMDEMCAFIRGYVGG